MRVQSHLPNVGRACGRFRVPLIFFPCLSRGVFPVITAPPRTTFPPLPGSARCPFYLRFPHPQIFFLFGTPAGERGFVAYFVGDFPPPFPRTFLLGRIRTVRARDRWFPAEKYRPLLPADGFFVRSGRKLLVMGPIGLECEPPRGFLSFF